MVNEQSWYDWKAGFPFVDFENFDLRTLQANSYDGTSEHVYVYRPGHEKHNVNMYAEFIFTRIKLAMTEHKTASKAENGKSDALHCDPYKIIRNGAATISNYRVINDLWHY